MALFHRRSRSPLKRLAIILAGVLALLGMLAIGFFWFLVITWLTIESRYLVFEVPKVKTQLARIPGVSLEGMVSDGAFNEINVYYTLFIEGKGTLVLEGLTEESFSLTAGDIPIIISISDCQLWTISYGKFTEERIFKNVQEIVENYDWFYEKMKAGRNCVFSDP
jgi:hypothetical protein